MVKRPRCRASAENKSLLIFSFLSTFYIFHANHQGPLGFGSGKEPMGFKGIKSAIRVC